jgi:D-serine dehydratase
MERFQLDWQFKSLPPGGEGVWSDEIASRRWNVLRQDLLLPAAVLKDSALRHNSEWMRRFLELTGAKLCPHGKTSMSPELFAMQFADGAWGMTAATAAHIRIYRELGIKRIFLANQLIGRQNIAYVLDALRRDPSFDFYCIVDSLAAVTLLDDAVHAAPIGRRLNILIELGIAGGRSGVRTNTQARHVAEAVAASRHLSLRGIEAFEGIVQGKPTNESEPLIQDLIERMVAIAEACDGAGLFGGGEILLTAGGSAFFDVCAKVLKSARLNRTPQVILRSGCYLTHDSGFYNRLIQRMSDRSPELRDLGPGLKPALEVWAAVHARPEPTRVIAGLGKRDISFDVELPQPETWLRAGGETPKRLDDTHRVIRLDDQHAYIDVPEDSPLLVGDLLSFGISHPCTTFDRWRAIFRVDDRYNVTGAVRTLF